MAVPARTALSLEVFIGFLGGHHASAIY